MATIETTGTRRPAGIEARPAGLLPRAAALLIDYGIALAASIAVAAPTRLACRAGGLGDGTSEAMAMAAALAAIAAYFAGLESSTSQGTLGKIALGLQVADLDGRPIGFGRALGRLGGKVLSLIPFGIGFLMAADSERHRALHDLLAGTVVLRVR